MALEVPVVKKCGWSLSEGHNQIYGYMQCTSHVQVPKKGFDCETNAIIWLPTYCVEKIWNRCQKWQ